MSAYITYYVQNTIIIFLIWPYTINKAASSLTLIEMIAKIETTQISIWSLDITRNIFKKDIWRLSNTDDKRDQIRWQHPWALIVQREDLHGSSTTDMPIVSRLKMSDKQTILTQFTRKKRWFFLWYFPTWKGDFSSEHRRKETFWHW